METKTLIDYENEAIRLLQECGTNNIEDFTDRIRTKLLEYGGGKEALVRRFMRDNDILANLLKAVTELEIISPDDLEYIASAPWENIHGNLGELGLYQNIYDECRKLKHEEAMLAKFKEYIKT